MTHSGGYLHTEGDLNLSKIRERWNDTIIEAVSKVALKNDADHYLDQALSTPCLDVLESAEGIRIKNLFGKSYIDFHGSNVHQLGYRNDFRPGS